MKQKKTDKSRLGVNQSCIVELHSNVPHILKNPAMKQANIPETELETISDLVKITRMGIITTPALIVDGKLLCCGKVLSVEELLPLLKQNSEPKAE